MNKYTRKVLFYLKLKEKTEIMYKEQYTLCRKYKYFKILDDLDNALDELYAFEFFQSKLKSDKLFEMYLIIPKRTIKNNLLTNILKNEISKNILIADK